MKKTILTLVIASIAITIMANPVEIGVTTNEDPKTIIGIAVVALYEIMARVIPTVKDYTILGRIIKWVNKISQYLNVKKY